MRIAVLEFIAVGYTCLINHLFQIQSRVAGLWLSQYERICKLRSWIFIRCDSKRYVRFFCIFRLTNTLQWDIIIPPLKRRRENGRQKKLRWRIQGSCGKTCQGERRTKSSCCDHGKADIKQRSTMFLFQKFKKSVHTGAVCLECVFTRRTVFGQILCEVSMERFKEQFILYEW